MSDNNFGTTVAGTMNDTLEFVRNFWGSMKVPGMPMPSMSPDDLNKQIAALTSVDPWLQTNLSILRGTIQTPEVQNATRTARRRRRGGVRLCSYLTAGAAAVNQ